MSIIGIVELARLFLALCGLILLFRRRKSLPGREAGALLICLFVWACLDSVAGSVEWTGLSSVFDSYEDYLQIFVPIFWGCFFYAWIMGMELERRRKGEERLRISEERLSLAVAGTRIILWDWQVRSGRVILSEVWTRLLGHELDEDGSLSVEEWRQRVHPHDLERFDNTLKHHLDGHDEFFDCEIRMEHVQRRWLWMMVCGKVFERDAHGKALRMAGSLQDITQRKLYEESIRTESTRLKALMDIANDGIAIMTQDHRVVSANAAFARMLGYDMDEIIGMRTWDWDDTMDEREIRSLFPNIPVIQATIETRHRRKDGSTFDVEVSVGGAVVGDEDLVVTISRDVSERKKMEQHLTRAKEMAEEANMAKSEFLANMSHEIRTPLNGILGMLQLLEYMELGHEEKEYIHNALVSTNRLTGLLSDLLDFSQIEAGRLEVLSEPMDLNEIIEQTGDLFAPVAMQSGVEFSLVVAPDIPRCMLGDSGRLQQILTNLVGNAFKFTERGQVSVEAIRLPLEPQGAHRILIIVSDTGSGIDEESLPNLFEPFVQACKGFRKTHQGAGLGLSICRRLVGLMGGTLAVESSPGNGSQFYLSLPFERMTIPVEHVESKAANVAPPNQDIRVLLAEDDPFSALSGKRQLEKAGCQVTVVSSGPEILESLHRESYDMVLMDVQMPGLDWMETTQAIRAGQAGKQVATIPIIALTANVISGERERILASGMNGYLKKPMEHDEFMEMLHRFA